MVFPITTSDMPLEFDTLPAVKCRHWQPGARRVYTMARLYLSGDEVQLSLSAFERDPLPSSLIVFTLAANGQTAQVFLSPLKATLWRTDSPEPLLPSQGFRRGIRLATGNFSGNDEQGWYWGATLALPCDRPGVVPGSTWNGGLAKYQGDVLLGTSYAPTEDGDQFLIVNY